MKPSSLSGLLKNPGRSKSVSSFSFGEMLSVLRRWSVTLSWLKL